ncbi:unnamed protein product [Paramecium sonneborni]|uniref:CRC domain-containing protein n=1 Tax=Paramecium sonneborni TaxID=65129 RepID=A0A8S1KUG2_9CILI|nr:unnamed protein product [Paramecium sonneborni]
MKTRGSKIHLQTPQINIEIQPQQIETIADPIITRIDIDNEDQIKQPTILNFHQNLGIKKLQITKSYPIEKTFGFKANKTRNKPIILDMLNIIQQGQDNKLYDVMDFHQFMSLKDQQQSQNVPKSLRCKCNKSMCLKQYCDCFANGQICTNQCQCQGCHNSEEYIEEREEAINRLKIQNLSFEKEVPIGISCKCKKSKCTKKYCDCFQNKQKCNENCQCNNCENQLEKIEYIDQRDNQHSQAQLDENSRLPRSPIFCRGQYLFRKNDSMNYSNSFGYSRRFIQEGPYFLKQDSQGFN